MDQKKLDELWEKAPEVGLDQVIEALPGVNGALKILINGMKPETLYLGPHIRKELVAALKKNGVRLLDKTSRFPGVHQGYTFMIKGQSYMMLNLALKRPVLQRDLDLVPDNSFWWPVSMRAPHKFA